VIGWVGKESLRHFKTLGAMLVVHKEKGTGKWPEHNPPVEVRVEVVKEGK